MKLRLAATGRELRGAVRDPETGVIVWARGGLDASRQLAKKIEEQRRRAPFLSGIAWGRASLLPRRPAR